MQKLILELLKKNVLSALILVSTLAFGSPLKASDTARVAFDTTGLKLADLQYQKDLYDITSILPYHEAYQIWDTVNVHPYRFEANSLHDTVKLILSDHQDCDFSSPSCGYVISGFGYRTSPKYHYTVVKRGKKGKKGKYASRGRRVKKHFVGYGSHYHQGVDIDLDMYDSVYSAFDGIVRISQFNPGGYGNCIVIRHYNGLETLYGHLSVKQVKVGQHVRAGELIGLAGSTGHSTGPHLHFETRYKGLAIDPQRIIDFGTKQEHAFKLKVDTLYVSKYTFMRYNTFARGKRGSRARAAMYASKYYKKGAGATRGYHAVKSGENLYRIAKRYGISINKICQLNNIQRDGKLKLGQKLKIN